MRLDTILQNLPDARQRLDAAIHAYADLLFILDSEGTILDYQSGGEDELFIIPSVCMGRKMQDILPDDIARKFLDAMREARSERRMVQYVYSLPMPSGERWYEARIVPQPNGQNVVVVRNITGYKRAEEKIQRQFDQLSALRSIDLAIASGLGLNPTLSMILSHIIAQLNMDAADILLLDPNTKTLDFAAGVGFHTSALRHTHLKMGEGHAGQAAENLSILHINNLQSAPTDFLRSSAFKEEAFVTYYAVPLVAKNQVLGVLEIFCRALIAPDPEWSDFMSLLAGYAAIAIENAMLFKHLQHSNQELTLAYDKTIEGWSRALDLRDHETEHHTRRVVEMTLKLARRMNIPEENLVHIRRGATLHDIGKVSISDNVLLKPGPLSAEEWVLMQRHPIIAMELLSPISYLAPALDIPRSHHEKWDGTGYPEGLAGERIPLAARIFTIVDVYDALTSNRPYRLAWSQAKTLEYIRSLSGIHFDPNVVRVFLDMIGDE